MGSRAFVVRVLRMLPVAALLALALQPGGVPALRPVPPVVAASGGCSPASPTCYLFDVHLGTGPGIGTGFGTYRTMGDDGYTGRIDCHYGNETQTGVCGWGYESSTEGAQVDVFYVVSPDPGSKVCDLNQCYDDDFTGDQVITGNYAENSWYFLLIQAFQIDVVLEGTGSGTVTSGPPGIACPDDCTDIYAANQPVTLTAKAKTGSVFAGWSGDYCTGKNTTCQITTDFLQSVTARFDKQATARPATAPPTKAPTKQPTEEPTEDPTEGSTPVPTDVVASPTAEPTGTAEPTIASSAVPVPTAVPSPASDSGVGNLPIVIGLAVLLVVLVGGAVYVARRPTRGG